MIVLPRRRVRIVSLLAIGLAFAAVGVSVMGVSQRQPSDDFKPVRVVQAFPPITEFPVKPVREAHDSLNPSELVLGVTVGKESRAYPINMLTGPVREILNDKLGGQAIAATW